jgi:sulfatase modifying factor 1
LGQYAEWGYAAAGGSQQLEFPWGSTAPGAANQYAIYDCYHGGSGQGTCTGVANLAPVGTAALGAGLWGQLDMLGEARQWDLDWYATYVDPCTDCAYLSSTSNRVFRGVGAAGTGFAWIRGEVPPALRGMNDGIFGSIYGARCARAP